MEKRPALILKLLTEEYIKTATPVASQTLVEKYGLDFSPATVRNDLADLEEKGYIKQPHTSAGRIPSELAYRYFIKQLKNEVPSREVQNILKPYFDDLDNNWKPLAKTLAQLTDNGIFWSFHRYDSYYTGLSGLLGQPEFKQLPLVYDISQVIDSLEEIISDIFDEIPEKPVIRLGSDSPFGPFSSTILTKYRYGENLGLFGLLTPIRNDYQKNFNLINYVYNHIQKKG